MGKDENKTHIPNQFRKSGPRVGGDKIFEKIQKSHMGKDEGKTNVSWFKIGDTNRSTGGRGSGIFHFLKNSKNHLLGRTRRRRITSFIAIR